jgi:hypothetical protein
MDLQPPDEETMVRVAVADLENRLEAVEPARIEATVRRNVHALFTRARVKSFVGIIAERHAQAELEKVGIAPDGGK